MKKIFYLLAGLAALFLTAGCGGKDEPDVPPTPALAEKIAGSWHLTSANYTGIDVWLSFETSGSFILYQKNSEEAFYNKFTGTFTVEGDKLSGTYSNGDKWNATYTAKVSVSTLTLTADGESLDYTKDDIPSRVTDHVHSTKATGEGNSAPEALQEAVPLL